MERPLHQDQMMVLSVSVRHKKPFTFTKRHMMIDEDKQWVDMAKKNLMLIFKADEEEIWTDEECFRRNAHQHNQQAHPYTCGNDSNHRPLIATPHGWKCADCDYTQKH